MNKYKTHKAVLKFYGLILSLPLITVFSAYIQILLFFHTLNSNNFIIVSGAISGVTLYLYISIGFKIKKHWALIKKIYSN